MSQEAVGAKKLEIRVVVGVVASCAYILAFMHRYEISNALTGLPVTPQADIHSFLRDSAWDFMETI